MPYWTRKEDGILRERYPTERAEGCVEFLPRHTRLAIYARAVALRLVKKRAAVPQPRPAPPKPPLPARLQRLKDINRESRRRFLAARGEEATDA